MMEYEWMGYDSQEEYEKNTKAKEILYKDAPGGYTCTSIEKENMIAAIESGACCE